MVRKFLIALLCTAAITSTKVCAWSNTSNLVAANMVQELISEETVHKMNRLYEDPDALIPNEENWDSSFYWLNKVVQNSLFHLYDWQIYPKAYDPDKSLSDELLRLNEESLRRNSIVHSAQHAYRVLTHSKASKWERNFMLRVLISSVLDLHQPCRCVSLYNEHHPKGNRAGFATCVIYEGRTHILVNLWDGLLGATCSNYDRDPDTIDRITAQALAKDLLERYPIQCEEKIFPSDFARWAEKSYETGICEVYQGIKNDFVIDSEYIERCKTIAESQLVLAAHRLAIILEAVFR